MEKRKGRRILYKLALIIIVCFLSYIIIFGGVKDYFDKSDNLWYPIFQSILFLMFMYLITFRFINPIVYKLYSDILYLFKKKEIRVIKESDGSYSIVKTIKTGKISRKILTFLYSIRESISYVLIPMSHGVRYKKRKVKPKDYLDAQEWIYSGIKSKDEAKQKLKYIHQENLKQMRKKKLDKLNTIKNGN